MHEQGTLLRGSAEIYHTHETLLDGTTQRRTTYTYTYTHTRLDFYQMLSAEADTSRERPARAGTPAGAASAPAPPRRATVELLSRGVMVARKSRAAVRRRSEFAADIAAVPRCASGGVRDSTHVHARTRAHTHTRTHTHTHTHTGRARALAPLHPPRRTTAPSRGSHAPARPPPWMPAARPPEPPSHVPRPPTPRPPHAR